MVTKSSPRRAAEAPTAATKNSCQSAGAYPLTPPVCHCDRKLGLVLPGRPGTRTRAVDAPSPRAESVRRLTDSAPTGPTRKCSAAAIPSGSPSGPVTGPRRSAHAKDAYKVLSGSPNPVRPSSFVISTLRPVGIGTLALIVCHRD
jgi:hypothetical protein